MVVYFIMDYWLVLQLECDDSAESVPCVAL